MQMKIDVEHINDEKNIPSVVFTILFMIFIFWLIPRINVPLDAEKPSEEIMLSFIKEEPKEEKKKEEKKEEKKKSEEKKEEIKPTEIQVDQRIQIDQPVMDNLSQEISSVDQPMSNFYQDFNQLPSGQISEPTLIGGADGVTDIVTDLNPNNMAILDAGANKGGPGVGFDGMTDTRIGSSDPSLINIGPVKNRVRTPTKAKSINIRPNLNLKGKEFINPIIKWMENNPYEFVGILKIFMDYSSGNLTSRVSLGNNQYFYLLCKRELPQLTILLVDFSTNEFTQIKDAGLLKEPGYLKEGMFTFKEQSGDKIFGYFEGEQRNATSDKAEKFNNRFWVWFDTVKPR
jgi:hypothetical protein